MHVCGVDRPPTCCFFVVVVRKRKKEGTKATFFQRERGTQHMGGALGGKGKGLCFFFFSSFPLIRIPALRSRVGSRSYEWRSRSCCKETDVLLFFICLKEIRFHVAVAKFVRLHLLSSAC